MEIKENHLSTSSLIRPSYTIRATIFQKVFRPEKFHKTEYCPIKRIIPLSSRTCMFSSRTCKYLCYILSSLRRWDYSAAIQELFSFLGIRTKHFTSLLEYILLNTAIFFFSLQHFIAPVLDLIPCLPSQQRSGVTFHFIVD